MTLPFSTSRSRTRVTSKSSLPCLKPWARFSKSMKTASVFSASAMLGSSRRSAIRQFVNSPKSQLVNWETHVDELTRRPVDSSLRLAALGSRLHLGHQAQRLVDGGL